MFFFIMKMGTFLSTLKHNTDNLLDVVREPESFEALKRHFSFVPSNPEPCFCETKILPSRAVLGLDN